MGTLLVILFVVVCILLIGVILVQKGRGGGLAAAFGGAGGHSAFGSRTGDAFTWITVVLVALFFLLAIGAVKVLRPPEVVTRTAAPATQLGDQEPTDGAEEEGGVTDTAADETAATRPAEMPPIEPSTDGPATNPTQ